MAESSIKFQAMMNEKRKRGEMCDFKIKVQGKTFPVHRLVLDTCSKYFHWMFASDMREAKEGVCELTDDEAEVVEICIEFMYTEKLDINADTAPKVLKLAHIWQLNEAVEKCEEFLCDNLLATCCFSYWRLASVYELKHLLKRCNELVFLNTLIVKDSAELEDVSYAEMRTILQEWTLPYSYDGDLEKFIISNVMLQEENSSKSVDLWILFIKWGEYKKFSTEFCEIVQQFPISLMLATDFIENVLKNQHIKKCTRCEENVCKEFLGGGNATYEISVENCLMIKHLANIYDNAHVKSVLADFIVENYKTIFLRPEFNELVPSDDFMAYMKRLQDWKISKEKFSVIISWIKFNPSREIIFQHLLKDEKLESQALDSIFTLENVLLIETLSDRYSFQEVHTATVWFIVKNFLHIIRLPESLSINSKNLVMYLKFLKTYGEEPEEIWTFILNWVNHHYNERREEFPTIFQALQLDLFSFVFVRSVIRKHELVKNSADCMSHLLDFIMFNVDVLYKKIEDIEKKEKRGWPFRTKNDNS